MASFDWRAWQEPPMKYVVWGVAILLTILVGILIGGSLGGREGANSERSCALMESQPGLKPPRGLTTESPFRGLVLAKMAAYINVHAGGYLPLEFEQVFVNDDTRTVIFQDRCVNVSMDFYFESDWIIVRDLKWSFAGLAERAANSVKPYEHCDMVVPSVLGRFTSTWRYSCLEPRAFYCKKPSGTDGAESLVATLAIESLELEFDADPKRANKGEFSKKPYIGSCEPKPPSEFRANNNNNSASKIN